MSDTLCPVRNPQDGFPLRTLVSCAATMSTAAYALVSGCWHRYRSRLELASYSHAERKDLGFSAELDHEIGKLFWKK
jgi:hypothetical protein